MLTYERYAEIRDSRGLKDSDVCRLTGIAQGSISDWKHGRTVPKADKVEKIADALSVPVSVLTGAVDSGLDYLLSVNNNLHLIQLLNSKHRKKPLTEINPQEAFCMRVTDEKENTVTNTLIISH